ncbi:MAG: hypothetical protein JXD21_00435 [Candidatus Omnitrophica bacterium]|nr:hypothetical protein [Candidatus Omnitrophota bacterium]
MKKTPTGRAVTVCAWILLGIGIVGSMSYWYFYRSWWIPVLCIGGSVISALVLKLFVNIGEFLFFLVNNNLSILEDIRRNQLVLERIRDAVEDVSRKFDPYEEYVQRIHRHLNTIECTSQEKQQIIERLACDVKDMNQNFYELTKFLENIEKELDLKR